VVQQRAVFAQQTGPAMVEPQYLRPGHGGFAAAERGRANTAPNAPAATSAP